jgi:DNA helicase HerA-like ATPase
VQHALRAFTPRDQKAVKATATTMRPNPGLDIEAAITELAVGEALISFLDEKGRPSITQRVYVVPPGSQIGPITAAQRQQLMQQSLVAGVYEKAVDRESAYEVLRSRAESAPAAPGKPGVAGTEGTAGAGTAPADSGMMGELNDLLFGTTGPRGGKKDGIVQTVVKSTARTMGTQLGRQILRGVLGGIFGGKSR